MCLIYLYVEIPVCKVYALHLIHEVKKNFGTIFLGGFGIFFMCATYLFLQDNSVAIMLWKINVTQYISLKKN